MRNVDQTEGVSAYQVNRWVFRPRFNRIESDGRVVRLEPKLSALLVCLVERPGDVFTKDELMARVWGDVVVSDQALAKAVSKLRMALNDAEGSDAEIIEAVWKSGYRLTAEVTPVAVGVEPGRRLHPSPVQLLQSLATTGRGRWIVAMATLGLFAMGWGASLVALYWRY